MTVYNRKNFHKHTYCVFTEVPFGDRGKPDYTSKSGSQYFCTEDGVLRISNHWGRAANCKWKLKPLPDSVGRTKAGFAAWSSFHHDNERDKLYYLEVDIVGRHVDYVHRDSRSYDKAFLRTASDTTRRIKEVRHFFTDDRWLLYYDEALRDTIRQELIDKLVNTNETLSHLKVGINQKYTTAQP